MPEDSLEPEELKRCNEMATEALAWLDNRILADEDKLSLVAGLVPGFMIRLTRDKAKFDKIKDFIVKGIGVACDNAWKQQDCTHDYADGRPGVVVCRKCNFMFPGRAS